jgi:hypothetical protein
MVGGAGTAPAVERASLARPWLAEEHHDAHPICIRALCPEVFCNAQKSAVNVESTLIVSPANHGLASEARSTVSSVDARQPPDPAARLRTSNLKFLLYLHIIVPAKGVGCRGVEAVAPVNERWVCIDQVVNAEG